MFELFGYIFNVMYSFGNCYLEFFENIMLVYIIFEILRYYISLNYKMYQQYYSICYYIKYFQFLLFLQMLK